VYISLNARRPQLTHTPLECELVHSAPLKRLPGCNHTLQLALSFLTTQPEGYVGICAGPALHGGMEGDLCERHDVHNGDIDNGVFTSYMPPVIPPHTNIHTYA